MYVISTSLPFTFTFLCETAISAIAKLNIEFYLVTDTKPTKKKKRIWKL